MYDRRSFFKISGAAVALSVLPSYARGNVNVSREFLSDFSIYLARFVSGTKDVQFALISAVEGDTHYMTSYGLETASQIVEGVRYPITRLKPDQPLKVRLRNKDNPSAPVRVLGDTDLDGILDLVYIETIDGAGRINEIGVDLKLLPKDEIYNFQLLYEKSLRIMRRKMPV